MAQVFLVRHGQASFGAADYDQLSALGEEQSRLLGAWFSGCGLKFDRVVVGGLKRHRQTAVACLGAMADVPPAETWIEDAQLEEYDHIEMLHRHRPDLAEREAMARYLTASGNPPHAFQQLFEEAMARWMAGEHDHEYRESWSRFRGRCVGALRRVLDDVGRSKRAVIFTSGGPISAITQELFGLTDARAAQLNWSIVNTAVSKLLHNGERVTLSYLNAYPHLEQSGRRDTITYR
ncbi:MAG: histidine phosphatase family protein [Dongiaceae bacterium]